MPSRLTCLALVTLVLTACGGSSPSDPADALDTDDTAAFSRHGEGQVSVDQLLKAVDQSLAFDPVIDPTKSAAENAQAIATQAKATTPCVQASANAATVTLTYPAPSGCTADGVTLIGTLAMTVSKDATTITVTATFTSFNANGKVIDGTVKFVTSNGSVFTVTPTVTVDTKSLAGTLTVTGSSGAYSVSGALSTTSGGVTTTATLTDVKQTKGTCYPSSGTAAIKSGARAVTTVTMTFLSTTPTDGKVSVTKGRATTSQTLPPYGSCPGH